MVEIKTIKSTKKVICCIVSRVCKKKIFYLFCFVAKTYFCEILWLCSVLSLWRWLVYTLQVALVIRVSYIQPNYTNNESVNTEGAQYSLKGSILAQFYTQFCLKTANKQGKDSGYWGLVYFLGLRISETEDNNAANNVRHLYITFFYFCVTSLEENAILLFRFHFGCLPLVTSEIFWR